MLTPSGQITASVSFRRRNETESFAFPRKHTYSGESAGFVSLTVTVLLISWSAMAPTTDEEKVSLIECLRPRLEELIVASQVLDLIQFIDEEQKERIRQRERTEGNRSATALLVTAVLKKPHSPGWFRAFLDALIGARCLYAADLVEQKLPDPQVEAENDECVHLIRLLSPSLVDMKVDHVVVECFSKKLLTQADREIVSTPVQVGLRGPCLSVLHWPQDVS